MLLETSQNSQENTFARVSIFKKETLAQVFSCEFFETCKNTFSYRTPPVAASDHATKQQAGEGRKRVGAVFTSARKSSKSIYLFINFVNIAVKTN